MAFEIRLLDGMKEVAAVDWDRLACPEAADGGRPIDPFTTHRFLFALDRSRSTGRGTGWQPRPLVLTEDDRPIAAMPLYVKSHSQGEYIFDWGWAEALERAGGRYYPKLQCAVPFTPATGRRFLGPPEWRQALMRAAIGITADNKLSSLHVTFCTGEEAQALEGLDGTLHRVTQQFHWENAGYTCYQDFLDQLSSRKRKALRKERDTAQGHGLTIRALTGDDITPAHWDAMWTFYQDTGSRKWGQPYLTRAFFDEMHDTMRQDILLIFAFDGEKPVAGAMNCIGRDTLFGRYWGCTRDYSCLHFELCYHQAIDWAIAHGLKRVEAGAQGEHKLARGYLPVEIHSLHWIADPAFRSAVDRYLRSERQNVGQEIEVLTAYGPFRRGELQERD